MTDADVLRHVHITPPNAVRTRPPLSAPHLFIRSLVCQRSSTIALVTILALGTADARAPPCLRWLPFFRCSYPHPCQRNTTGTSSPYIKFYSPTLRLLSGICFRGLCSPLKCTNFRLRSSSYFQRSVSQCSGHQ